LVRRAPLSEKTSILPPNGILTTDSETVLVRVIVKLEMKNVYENITPSMMLVLFLSGRKERMGIKLSMQ
jgi:hypothetical protein